MRLALLIEGNHFQQTQALEIVTKFSAQLQKCHAFVQTRLANGRAMRSLRRLSPISFGTPKPSGFPISGKPKMR